MDLAVKELVQRALTNVVASSRTVTQVAVTVLTAIFYANNKIRKLDAHTTPSQHHHHRDIARTGFMA